MSAPVKKCEVCDDTGSKSCEFGGDLDCTSCDSATERMVMRKKLGLTWGDDDAWRAYQLGKAAAAPVVPVAAQPVVQQEPITLPFSIEAEEMTAFRRFYECALDGEGHDVPASMMKSLAGIGLVQRRHASYYETTDFGLAVLDGKFAAPSLEAQPAGEVAQLDQVREAVLLYFDALTARQHGGVAQDKAFSKIQDALGLYWQFGVDHRAMAQGEKAK